MFDLCRQLAAAGHDITVLAPHAKGACCRERMDGISVRRFRYAPEAWERLAYQGGIMSNLKRFPLLYALVPFFLLAQFVALVRCLRETRYDAVHAHWIVPQGLLLGLASPFSRGCPRLVCTVHGSDVSSLLGKHWSWVRRRVAARCDHVVAVSDALRERLVNEKCPEGKLSVIPMGSDLGGLFVPDEKRRSSAELLFVGRLVAVKGVDTLISALPAIRMLYPEASLTIVGDGPERGRLVEIAQRLGVADQVKFVGAERHEALPEHYRRATLLVLPSRAEGFGLVTVEAMGCACPVVASDLPALRDLLRDGQAGRLFRPGDVAGLEDKIFELLANETLRIALGEEGRNAVLERYDWRSVSLRYASVLLS